MSRDLFRDSLGDRFDIRRFHEALLGSGSMPLFLLERHVDWFIAQEKDSWFIVVPMLSAENLKKYEEKKASQSPPAN